MKTTPSPPPPRTPVTSLPSEWKQQKDSSAPPSTPADAVALLSSMNIDTEGVLLYSPTSSKPRGAGRSAGRSWSRSPRSQPCSAVTPLPSCSGSRSPQKYWGSLSPHHNYPLFVEEERREPGAGGSSEHTFGEHDRGSEEDGYSSYSRPTGTRKLSVMASKMERLVRHSADLTAQLKGAERSLATETSRCAAMEEELASVRNLFVALFGHSSPAVAPRFSADVMQDLDADKITRWLKESDGRLALQKMAEGLRRERAQLVHDRDAASALAERLQMQLARTRSQSAQTVRESLERVGATERRARKMEVQCLYLAKEKERADVELRRQRSYIRTLENRILGLAGDGCEGRPQGQEAFPE
jgi:hypothetical protein